MQKRSCRIKKNIQQTEVFFEQEVGQIVKGIEEKITKNLKTKFKKGPCHLVKKKGELPFQQINKKMAPLLKRTEKRLKKYLYFPSQIP